MPLTLPSPPPLAAAGFRPSPAAARLDAALRRAAWSGRPLLGGCCLPDGPWRPAGDPGDLAAVAAVGTGAVYLRAAGGVTSTSAAVDPCLAAHVRQARDVTGLPVITGIGITSPARAAAAAAASASGIVIGSAFAREVAARPADPGGAVRDLAASRENACAAPA